ncbi:hypothetical protein L6164_007833 [Bauhinia variegata]|uniref:Uncharacterized protein n=1 Tax=Bauhinia variegata TaxID=167791 RepID=A0ACB9PEY1_BAUVA|nr:hypothetical protein L6164_007833 [Bauhinia variegata]
MALRPFPNVADSSLPASTPEAIENNVQPFFVLHKASSGRKERTSAGQGKLRKRNELSSSSPQSTKKLEGRIAEESGGHWFQQLQVETFDLVWSKIESTIKDVLRDTDASVFNQIQKWVMECFNATRSVGEPSFDEATRSFPILSDNTPSQLFAGLVITRNIEFVDDILTFKELSLFLKSHGCHVAMLSSLDFSVKNGISGCLKALLQEFLDAVVDAADMSILASWYREQGNYDKPLVVIINDLERCCGAILSDFILLLSEWVVKVPIVLIIGVATTVDAPKNIIPLHVLQQLCPCKFMLGSPAERMDAVVEAVLVKHCTRFTIGHKVALFLRNYFLNQDGTLTSFIRALKTACILHFSMEPLSLILGKILTAEQKDGNFSLSAETMLEYVSELPSHVRNQMVDQTGKNLAQDLLELVVIQKLWSTAVLCLCEAGKHSRVRLLDLFVEVLNSDLHLPSGFGSHLGAKNGLVLSSSKDQCQQHGILQRGGIICQIARKVRDLPTVILHQLVKRWEELTADVSEIHEKLEALQSSLRCEDDKSSNKISKENSKRHASRIPLSIGKDSGMINSQAVAFMDCLIRNYIRPIESLPFHEIFCFKNVEKLQLALIGDPRRAIQLDLLESHKILGCSCCKKSGSALLPSMHDSSILHSLSQEHGDLINLHDWFQSFTAIVLHHKTKRKQKAKQSPLPKKRKDTNESRDTSEASIQARFCKAATELQITGLVRMPSKRRPDFVQRIAFGI